MDPGSSENFDSGKSQKKRDYRPARMHLMQTGRGNPKPFIHRVQFHSASLQRDAERAQNEYYPANKLV